MPYGRVSASPACLLATVLLVLTGATSCVSPEPPPAEVAEVAVEEIPVTTDSAAAVALFQEGEYFADVGRNVEARRKFQAAVAEDPGFVRAHLSQSNVALSFKEFQTCLDTASENLASASDGEKLMVEINRTFLTNDPDQGLKLAGELAAAYPNSPRAAIILAGMQGAMNENVGARTSLGRALELDPASAGALFGLAASYLGGEPKDFSKAEEWVQRAIAAYPDEAKGYELLGDIKRGQNDLEAARTAYNQAAATDPTLAVAQHKKGHVNSFLGNIEEARAAYDAGVAAAPPESRAGYAVFKAFTRIHEDNIPAALDELEALADGMEALGTPADQLKGNQIFAMNSHATAAMHAGLLDRAAQSVARGNELRMAVAEEVGTEDARRIQKAACHQWDGVLAAYRNQPAVAAEHAEAIAQLVADDQNPRKLEGYHFVLGMAALEAGDDEKAAEHLRQADYRNNMFIRYHLAEAEEALGNIEDAKRMFGEVGSFNFNSVGFALVGREAAARAAP